MYEPGYGLGVEMQYMGCKQGVRRRPRCYSVGCLLDWVCITGRHYEGRSDGGNHWATGAMGLDRRVEEEGDLCMCI
jgi:hypothetical protein